MEISTQNLFNKANENVAHLNIKAVASKVMLTAVICLLSSFQLFASTFTAIQSGDWSTPAVWLISNPTPGATNDIPDASDDVIIPAGYTIDFNTSQSINNLTLAGSFNPTTNGKKLTILGNVEFSGSLGFPNLLLQPASTFTFKGGNTFPNLTYGNVVINIPAGNDITTNAITKANLNGNPTILGSLTVLSGNLKVNSILDITGMAVSIVNPVSSISFGGTADIIRSNNFIGLSQGGKLIMENIGKGQGLKRQGNVLFPIGTLNGTYTPVTINNKEFNPATINGNFGVTVMNGVYQNGTDGPAVLTNVVNKTWVVTLMSGAADASITYQWNAADELTDFTAVNSKISEYTNNRWAVITGTTLDPVNRTIKRINALGNAATGPVTFPINAIQGGSIFPLPVELLYFNAVKKPGEVVLTWETASEKNNTGFEVQSSADGKNYEAIEFVATQNGNATVNQKYTYSDKITDKEGLVYYRLKQIDLDGTVSYYPAKAVDLGKLNLTASAYPNPFQSALKLGLHANAAEIAQVLVTDMTGKTIFTAEHQLLKGTNNLELNLEKLPAGLYFLKATTGSQTYTDRLIKN